MFNLDVVSIGEILMDMFPAEVGRRLADVSAFYPKPGGACANVAVAVARLGKQSAFVGKVGQDAFGHSLIKTLKENGVETRGMRIDEEVRTTMAFIAMPDENSAEFIFYRNPGADLCLSEQDLDLDLITSAKVIHCGSLLLVGDPARSAQYKAIEAAKAKGALISFDVNHRPKLWATEQAGIDQIVRLLDKVDILKVNENELALLTGSDDPEIGGRELVRQGVRLLAITLGTKGSYYFTEKCHGFIPPYVVKTVDAIGCGDAFISGLLTSILEKTGRDLNLSEEDLVESFTFANAVGAVTALTRGVIPALPTMQQVSDFMQAHNIQ